MMKFSLRALAIFEGLAIVLLVFLLVHLYSQSTVKTTLGPQSYNDGLLSPRVYSGLLKPQSHLILNFDPFDSWVRTYSKEKNVNFSLYVVNLRNGASLGINQENLYEPASLNKLPISIIILKKVEQGKLNLSQEVALNESYYSYPFIHPYNTTENVLPLRVLFERMLNESDNTATRALSQFINSNDLEVLSNYLDYYSSTPFVKDDASYLISPHSTYNLFSSLYLSTVLTPEDSEYILRLLTRTSFDITALADLPSNVTIAQKFGTYYKGDEEFFHSCGILYVEGSRMFYCVMTNNIKEDEAIEVVANVVHNLYLYTVQIKQINEDLPI